ncbi:hypothetical protein HDU92_002922 [Lobulomyces angularis]|nr:hypothetical protein HDU92_002922 [Lobulomyces angularis]
MVNTDLNTSSQKKRLRRKKSKQNSLVKQNAQEDTNFQTKETSGDLNIEIEYVAEVIPITEDNENLSFFNDVLERFNKKTEKLEAIQNEELSRFDLENQETNEENSDSKKDLSISEQLELDEQKKLSVKRQKRMQRISVAQLKQVVKNPELVDWVDVTSDDPVLLVHLKSYRNTVPIPIHWSQKRKYLQAKRGTVKKPFELPDFIKQTGITEMRGDIENSRGIKTRYIKTGRLDIDYQKLHDAFFRLQTKPKNLSRAGDIYFEGKEYESSVKTKKPGDLSEELIMALNMPPNAPPPWLINMQRYGPPPSYPNLRIPGLNAPIPDGAQWGFHPGGWGKPPVDEYNRPLYGDVFGLNGVPKVKISKEHLVPVEKNLWGELESDEEEEEEEPVEQVEANAEEEEDAEGDEMLDQEQAIDSFQVDDGLVTPSGMSSVPSGLETPDFIQLRKERTEIKSFGTVIKPKEVVAPKGGFMGSTHQGYDLGKKKGSEVEVSLDPEELEGLGDSEISRKYQEAQEKSKGDLIVGKGGVNLGKNREDLSDMVRENIDKRDAKNKRKNEDEKDDKKNKRKKKDNFKF